MIERCELFFLIFRIVFDNHLERAGDGECPGCAGIERFTDTVFQNAEFDILLVAGYANTGAEVHQRLGRVAPPPHSGQSRHARIIPAPHHVLLHQDGEEPLAHHRVLQR